MKLRKCKCHWCILQRRIRKILKKHKVFHELESFDFSFYPEFQVLQIRLAEVFGELIAIYESEKSRKKIAKKVLDFEV